MLKRKSVMVVGGITILNKVLKDFPGSPVVKNPPANSRDMGSVPGPGGFYRPQGN